MIGRAGQQFLAQSKRPPERRSSRGRANSFFREIDSRVLFLVFLLFCLFLCWHRFLLDDFSLTIVTQGPILQIAADILYQQDH